jgi:hypothetical protein
VALVSAFLSLSSTEYAPKENIKNMILDFKHQYKSKSILGKKKKKKRIAVSEQGSGT